MRILLSLLFLAAFALSAPVQARMYQWVDAKSGNVRLSGEPPAWYRSAERGPRVLVFENGQLVDDTAIVLPPEQRKAYREAAFLEMDLRREEDAVKKLERAALREARRREESIRQLSTQANPQQSTTESGSGDKNNTQATAPVPSAPVDPEASMVEQLKAILTSWDQQNSAKEKP